MAGSLDTEAEKPGSGQYLSLTGCGRRLCRSAGLSFHSWEMGMKVPTLAIVCVVSYEASLFIIISCALRVETYPIRGHCSLSLPCGERG